MNILCRLGIHRPFTIWTPLEPVGATYHECDRCYYVWYERIGLPKRKKVRLLGPKPGWLDHVEPELRHYHMKQGEGISDRQAAAFMEGVNEALGDQRRRWEPRDLE
jgi:hypothetical protein